MTTSQNRLSFQSQVNPEQLHVHNHHSQPDDQQNFALELTALMGLGGGIARGRLGLWWRNILIRGLPPVWVPWVHRRLTRCHCCKSHGRIREKCSIDSGVLNGLGFGHVIAHRCLGPDVGTNCSVALLGVSPIQLLESPNRTGCIYTVLLLTNSCLHCLPHTSLVRLLNPQKLSILRYNNIRNPCIATVKSRICVESLPITSKINTELRAGILLSLISSFDLSNRSISRDFPANLELTRPFDHVNQRLQAQQPKRLGALGSAVQVDGNSCRPLGYTVVQELEDPIRKPIKPIISSYPRSATAAQTRSQSQAADDSKSTVQQELQPGPVEFAHLTTAGQKSFTAAISIYENDLKFPICRWPRTAEFELVDHCPKNTNTHHHSYQIGVWINGREKVQVQECDLVFTNAYGVMTWKKIHVTLPISFYSWRGKTENVFPSKWLA